MKTINKAWVLALIILVPGALPAQEVPHPYSIRSSAGNGSASAEHIFFFLLIAGIFVVTSLAVIKYRKSR